MITEWLYRDIDRRRKENFRRKAEAYLRAMESMDAEAWKTLRGESDAEDAEAAKTLLAELDATTSRVTLADLEAGLMARFMQDERLEKR